MQMQMAADEGSTSASRGYGAATGRSWRVAQKQNRMIERVGDTMERLYRYYTDEQIPSFKTQMKGLCPFHGADCGLATSSWAFSGKWTCRRRTRPRSRITRNAWRTLSDCRADLENEELPGFLEDTSAETEELRLAIDSLQSEQEQVIIREGLVFDFPSSRPASSLIPRCTSLKGWIGADWIAEEIYMTCDEIKEFFNVDVLVPRG